MITIDQTISPIKLNDEYTIVDGALTGSGTITKYILVESESILSSLFVTATDGDIDVKIYTVGRENEELVVVDYPTISAPTTELLLKQPARMMQIIRIVVTYTDNCELNFKIRGVRSGAASVTIEGAATFQASQEDVTTTAAILLASALEDRNGILLFNNNVSSGTGIVYIGGLIGEATSAIGTPIYPGGTFTINLAAGAVLYAVSSVGTVDVRISQIG